MGVGCCACAERRISPVQEGTRDSVTESKGLLKDLLIAMNEKSGKKDISAMYCFCTTNYIAIVMEKITDNCSRWYSRVKILD